MREQQARPMDRFYHWLAGHSGTAVVWILAVVFIFAFLPKQWLSDYALWEHDPEWSRNVAMLATFIVAVVGGVIPIAKWREDQVQRANDLIKEMVEQKPIVVTN